MKILVKILAFTFLFIFGLIFITLLSFQTFKPKSLNNSKEISIYSHRGFNLKKENKEWTINFENNIEGILNSLSSYNGVEFDIHETKDNKHLILLHNENLDYFGLPNVCFSQFEYKISSPPKLDNKYAAEKLEDYFKIQPIKIRQRQVTLEDTNQLIESLENPFTNNKLKFWELKTGGKMPFGFYGFNLPIKTTNQLIDNNQEKSSVIISFYWWSPVIAKFAGIVRGNYIPTGIDVIGDLAATKFVPIAKLLGYDYFLPPHEKVTKELLIACKEYNMHLVSWSRGSPENEDKSILNLINIYSQLKDKEKPKIGFIVNQNKDHIKQLISKQNSKDYI